MFKINWLYVDSAPELSSLEQLKNTNPDCYELLVDARQKNKMLYQLMLEKHTGNLLDDRCDDVPPKPRKRSTSVVINEYLSIYKVVVNQEKCSGWLLFPLRILCQV